MLYLRNKLLKTGKSAAQFARELGVSPPTVCEWMSGRKLPTADKLPAIAAKLGCTIDALYIDDKEVV